MSPLSSEHKQILFDYCIGLTSPEQSQKARELISQSEEAAEIHSNLKNVFKPLDNIESEECPDDLMERTVIRVNNYSNSTKQLKELLNAEQTKKAPIKIGFLRNFSEAAAIAAVILLIAGLIVPTFGYARNRYWAQVCQNNMNNVYEGIQNYIQEHDGQQPSYPKPQDSFWWQIGNEDQSNTSHYYLLVCKKYVEPTKFICPGKKRKYKKGFDETKYNTYVSKCCSYKDFPNKNFVTYSFQIRCNKSQDNKLECRRILMADNNPIFEDLPSDYSKTILIKIRKDQLDSNSINHNNRGQNILFADGSVEFHKNRRIFGYDDIYTLRYTDYYEGNEIPSCAEDTFLAP